MKPVDLVHMADPHLHGLLEALAVVPSVTVHASIGNAEHKFCSAEQYLPLNELQAALPHAQSVGLESIPFVLVHVFPREHVLVGKLQYNPEVFVQVDVPQKHWS